MGPPCGSPGADAIRTPWRPDDLAGFGDEEIAEMLGRFSDLYHALSGDVLVIEGTETLDPSRAPTPEGVE